MQVRPEDVSKIVSDSYSLKMLGAAYIQPRTVQSLAIEYDIPIAAAYRRVKVLESMGLIKCVKKILTREGRRIGVYQSDVKNITVSFDRGRLTANIVMKDQPLREPDVVNLLTT